MKFGHLNITREKIFVTNHAQNMTGTLVPDLFVL